MAANDALDFVVYLVYRFSGWFLGLFPLVGVFRFGQAAGAIACAMEQQYPRHCAGRFRTNRWRMVLSTAEDATERRLD